QSNSGRTMTDLSRGHPQRTDETPEPRKGMPSPRLQEADFKRRFRAQFADQEFDSLVAETDKIAEAAWEAYRHSRKSPRTRPAGPAFADPSYELAVDWIKAREAIAAAQQAHDDPNGPIRILVVNASPRSEHTCPGEM